MSVSNRLLVTLTTGVTAALALALPGYSMGGAAAAVAVLLAVCDSLLLARTDALAFRRGAHLDELERTRRDRAHRRGFAIAVVSLAAMGLTGTLFGGGGPLWPVLPPALTGPLFLRQLIALAEIVLFFPTLVLAWNQRAPGRMDRRRDLLPAVVVAGAGAAALVAAPFLPVRVLTHVDAGSVTSRLASLRSVPAHCSTVDASAEVGLGAGGTVRLHAYACWDGAVAWVEGDPQAPYPSPSSDAPFPTTPSLTACAPRSGGDDMVVLSATCSGHAAAAGSYDYVVDATVASVVTPWWARTVRLVLNVTPHGDTRLSAA